MRKIKFDFEFTYFMGESTEEENAEYANYNINISNVVLLKQELDKILVNISDYLKKEIGHYITNNIYEEDEYIFIIKTDEVDSENILNVLAKFHTHLNSLFKDSKVEEVVKVGNNDLAHNTKKIKI